MADLESALVARLLADAPLAALVGTRIHWNFVPQGKALPYIRLQVISDPRPQTLKDYDAARLTRVQVDCMADKSATATAMGMAVIAAVAGPDTVSGVIFGRAKAEGPRGGGEDVPGTGFVHRASLDLLVEHRLA